MKYIINQNTLYLYHDGSNTIIREKRNHIKIDGNVVEKIINDSCIYNGSTLKGRIEAEKSLVNIKYKLPIIISTNNIIILFSVKIKDNKNIVWFNYNNIDEYFKDNGGIKIKFKGNITKILPISWTVFNNQILKSSRLLVLLLNRINN